MSKIINSFRKNGERENIIYSPFVDDERYIDGWFALHCWLVEIIILGEINLLSHYYLLFVGAFTNILYIHAKHNILVSHLVFVVG